MCGDIFVLLNSPHINQKIGVSMKKIIVLILSLSLLNGCDKIIDEATSDNSEYVNSISSNIENNQESDIVIMLYKECYSESTDVNAKMMTFDGKIIDVTDYVYNKNGERVENWTENISDTINEQSKKMHKK